MSEVLGAAKTLSLDGGIESIDFASVMAVRSIAGGLGSSGVNIVVLENGGAVVLKPGSASNLCSELFGSMVMCLVKNDGPRSLVPAESQMLTINRGLQVKKHYAQPEDYGVLFQRFNKGNRIWLLSEFVQGKSAYAFKTEDIDMQSVMHQLGRIQVVDSLLNNYDRIPVIHTNTGNMENWLITDGMVVSPIDTSTNKITAGPGRQQYFDKIREFVIEIKSGAPGACCDRLKKHLSEIGWTIEDKDLVAFLSGAASTIAQVSDWNREKLESIKNDVRVQFEASGLGLWFIDDKLAGVDIEFISGVLDVLST